MNLKLSTLLFALATATGAPANTPPPLPSGPISGGADCLFETEQLGSLLALATGFHEPGEHTRHRGQLARRILQRIESGFADPELTPEKVAGEVGISKRYLQTLLAGSGTGFVAEVNATRLDRASDLLTDPRSRNLAISDVAWRSGFLDPGYFTRQFRKRFGVTPREWRSGHAPQS